MKKIFTLLFMASCAVSMNAQGTYALAVDEAPKSGDQITSVANITMTYSEAGGADWKAAVADTHIDEGAVFGAYTAGNGTNGNKEGGTFVTLQPALDGTITVGIVANADKKIYVEEDGVALADFDGKTYSEKYYGLETFSVAAGKSYKVYVSGSKMGFYGFTYEAAAAPQTGYGFEGEGTAESPYLLKTVADFETLASKINAENTGAGEYFALANSIDFAGAALPMIALGGIENINIVSYGFEGELDGRGYTISGIKHDQPNKDDAASSYVGLISSLGENGVVRDLTVKGEINGYMYIGGVVGLMKGRVVNCNNYANITNTGAFAGGIAGGMIRGLGSISSCVNNGNITAVGGGSYPSGIIGGVQKKSDIENYAYEILDCTNYGNIIGTLHGAAGIAGNYAGKITDADNYGDITAPGSQYVGGIVACACDVLTLKECYNHASIVGGSKVGGIAGELRHAEALLDGCINAGLLLDEVFVGDVSATNEDETKVKNVGGVVGNSTKVGATIKHCASVTSVTVPASVETAGHLVGNADIVVEDCFFYAPDALLPLDDATLKVEDLATANAMWTDVFKGKLVATVMEQNIEFEDQEITIEYVTSDNAKIVIPSINYMGFTIDSFSVPVNYTKTEDGCVYNSGAFTALAGNYAIDGQSIDGVKTGDQFTLTTVFMVGGMPMPITATFNGTLENTNPNPDGIKAIEAVAADSAKYDLQGRRTNGETGLFIQNGKIFIVR